MSRCADGFCDAKTPRRQQRGNNSGNTGIGSAWPSLVMTKSQAAEWVHRTDRRCSACIRDSSSAQSADREALSPWAISRSQHAIFLAMFEVATHAADFVAVRRLFGEYRRAVEGFASVADVCA